jgi:hypothetical protein
VSRPGLQVVSSTSARVLKFSISAVRDSISTARPPTRRSVSFRSVSLKFLKGREAKGSVLPPGIPDVRGAFALGISERSAVPTVRRSQTFGCPRRPGFPNVRESRTSGDPERPGIPNVRESRASGNPERPNSRTSGVPNVRESFGNRHSGRDQGQTSTHRTTVGDRNGSRRLVRHRAKSHRMAQISTITPFDGLLSVRIRLMRSYREKRPSKRERFERIDRRRCMTGRQIWHANCLDTTDDISFRLPSSRDGYVARCPRGPALSDELRERIAE